MSADLTILAGHSAAGQDTTGAGIAYLLLRDAGHCIGCIDWPIRHRESPYKLHSSSAECRLILHLSVPRCVADCVSTGQLQCSGTARSCSVVLQSLDFLISSIDKQGSAPPWLH